MYSILVSRYGNVTVGGGCLVDSYYGKDFYDIDCFISYKDLKDEWKQQIELNNKNHIVHVFRDEINGFDIDIVVVKASLLDNSSNHLYLSGDIITIILSRTS